MPLEAVVHGLHRTAQRFQVGFVRHHEPDASAAEDRGSLLLVRPLERDGGGERCSRGTAQRAPLPVVEPLELLLVHEQDDRAWPQVHVGGQMVATLSYSFPAIELTCCSMPS